MRKNKGITLIALVITIIVLIILAGISIQLVLGDNGIITKAKRGTKDYTHATVKEAVMLKIAEYDEERATEKRKEDNFSSLMEDGIIIPIGEVRKDEIINRIGIIDVETLNGQKLKYGNGYGEQIRGNEFVFEDVYVIHLNNMGHFAENHLYYYDKENVANLGEITDSEERTDLGEIEDLRKEGNVEDLFVVDSEGTISLNDLKKYYWNKGERLPIGNLVIPKEIDGRVVKKIADNFLYQTNNEIESVSIPNTVTEIGEEAFGYYCGSLRKVELPESLSKIGKRAFRNCVNIKRIIIPTSVTNVGEEAFDRWESDQTIKVPFKEGEKPEGWDSNWNTDCTANIEYLK